MIDYTYKDLYNQDSVDKQISIFFDGGEITNTDLYSEAFELKESLCSEQELLFGACEASVLKFKMANVTDSLLNKKLKVTETIGGFTDSPFQFGEYKVFSDAPSGDRNYRDVIAYDAMYDIVNTDVSEWYETLEFPMTIKAFRHSFFEHLGVLQEETALIHDDLEIEKTITGTGISGKLIIVSICELNGVFGHINRNGKFSYISVSARNKNVIYPRVDLYPSKTLFTGGKNVDTNSVVESINAGRYISCEYEDFSTSYITQLQIRQEENDIGVIVGESGNTYVIEGNFLVYGKPERELEEIARKTLEKIRYTSYQPFKARLRGNPCLEVGDSIVLHTKQGNVDSYILERTLSGIQSLRDSFQANGEYKYTKQVNSLKKDIQQLKGKTNVLERTLDSTRSEIMDLENGLNTKIEQNTEKINASVQKIEENTNNSIDSVNGDIETLKQRVEASMTSEQVKLEIQTEIAKGSNKVETSTGYTFDENGLMVEKSGSEMKTQITEDGMKVFKNGEEVLIANNKGVDAVNLHASTYLIVGNNSRFEDYGDSRTGCFWIGS